MAGPTPRGLTFGSVADRYERYRPGYDDVVDLLLEGSPRTALEIGAGTGKATCAVAARGVRVTAVEPDLGMCAVLERTCAGLPVCVVRTTFEELVAQAPVDLLYSAAAWHWTDPATRWQRAAALIRPGGAFACLGGPIDVADERLAAEVERVREEVVGDEAVRSAQDDYAETGVRWPGNELDASPFFNEVRQVERRPTFAMPADDLIGLMSTVSAFLVLSDDVSDQVLRRIRGMLPDPVEVRRDLTVHLARRVAS